ncbi:MAG: ATP synthase F1 subunit epsilon [Mogibacterium sp.]|nr:ATP synthase F1 subunit epsilon [Mogibacterium sp.]
MDNFKLQIMASDHMVFDGDAQSVSLPTTEGSVGILAHHSNIIMAVVPGEITYRAADGSEETVIVSDGLLKVENGEAMILIDTAERPDEIDEARAQRAEERAREELKRANTNRDIALASAELSRAMSRIRASKKKHRI